MLRIYIQVSKEVIMDHIKNPMGLKLEEQPERTTGKLDYQIVEADGGSIRCPLKEGRPNVNPGCDTNCAFFFTRCNMLEALDLEIPK